MPELATEYLAGAVLTFRSSTLHSHSLLSVVSFVVIPLAGGMLTRSLVIKKNGKDYFENIFVKKFDGITTIFLPLRTPLVIFLSSHIKSQLLLG